MPLNLFRGHVTECWFTVEKILKQVENDALLNLKSLNVHTMNPFYN